MHCYDYPRPAVTVDIVSFTLHDGRLQLLLIRRAAEPYRGMWALPGGFVEMDEGLEEAARRELEEETGVSGLDLEQFHTFGSPGRDPRGRVISIAYLALVPPQRLSLRAASDAEAAEWFPMEALPPLAFDHAQVVTLAYQRLVARLDHTPIALQLLPEEFTLDELQAVHEAIRGEPLDSQRFHEWVLSLQQVQHSGRERREWHGDAVSLYRAIK